MRKILGLILGSWLVGGSVFAESLTLESYLKQVKSQGAGYRSAAAVEGLDKQSHQQDLIYSPQLTAGYNHYDDTQQPVGFSYPRTQTDTAGVSITDKLPFGPSLSLGYAFTNTNFTLPSFISALGPGGSSFLGSYYQIAPVISLSMPLFKDFGGSQTNAGVHKVQYQFESAEKNSAYQREGSIYQAKVAYWHLVLAQTTIKIRKDSLDRSRQIWEWTERRVKRNLAEAPDALQAEASVRVAELDLQMASENEKSARLQFNRYRDQGGNAVNEDLESLDDSLQNSKANLPENLSSRLDLKAVEATAAQQKAAYDEANQNILPDITVNASWRGNGIDPNYGPANQTALNFTYPTWTLGAEFDLPLDVFTAQRVSEGYQKNYESASLSLKEKQLEVSQEWIQLKSQLQDVDRRLTMAAEIEAIQKKKADQEKKRLEFGRTTEFQLLSFENDYNTARLNRLSVILEKLSILAQAEWWSSTDDRSKEERK